MLETARLVLRPLTTDDADALVELHADPRVHRFVSFFTRERAVERLASNERQWAERGYGLYAVALKSTGRFIGRCGLKYWPQFDEVEAGWVLRPDAWGHGYATEAARACVDWGFTHLGLDSITAMIAPANLASRRVAGVRPRPP
jgi:RimJ/RimL family protein N-acetyltransferase